MRKNCTPFFILLFILVFPLCKTGAQNVPVVIEVEDGNVGADFATEEDDDVKYITTTTNAAGDSPGSEARIVTMEVTFPAAQAYDLYVRVRVGAQAADDDSFFYGNGFGSKSPTEGGEWVRANNIHSIGYVGGDQIVDGDGVAGTGAWKWINLSEYSGDETPASFEVQEGALTQTFQIGAREDGLDIDKIAFARADYFYTVANLDNGEEGSETPDTGGGTLPIAEGALKYLGNVYSNSQVVGFTNYWNQVTPENAGKWGSVESSRDNMNWTGLDAAYNLARDNGFVFKLHVLIWGNQQPSWIEDLPADEQREEIEEWFQALAERYPDMESIEVVNEPLHDPPNSAGSGGGNYIDALGGTGSTGWDWVIEAFRLARQYFPEAKLMINDYNIVNSTSNTSEYLEIIGLLQEENLIDQIGVQAHAFSTRGSTTVMKNNLDALAETGLPLYVTELDIDGPSDQTQLEDYQRIFPIFWEHPAVEGITLWGFRPGMWRTEQMAYLIEGDGVTERPALIWLRDYVQGTITNTYEQVPAHQVSIYPNPVTNNQLIVDGIEGLRGAELYNLNGQKIWSTRPEGNLIEFNASVSPGMYILQLYNERHAFAKKVIFK